MNEYALYGSIECLFQQFLQPAGGWTGRQRNLGIGCGGQVGTSAMGHLPVAVPTDFSFTDGRHHVIDLAGVDKCRVEVGVAADTVVHDHLIGCLAGPWCLTFAVGDELGHMVEAVGRLEEILSSHVFVWHMAIVTGGVARMAGMVPGGVIGCHDVAVDASRRVIAQITVCPQQVEEKEATSDKAAQQHKAEALLPISEAMDKTGQLVHII